MMQLKKGDKIAVVSLSSGVLGEEFCKHQLELGRKRIEELGLKPVFMPNSLKGLEFVANNPDKRIEDLVAAFKNSSIKAILCAIGGMDAYKTIKYVLNSPVNREIIQKNPKIFIGFSDSTVHHLLLNKLGLSTFYGLSFLTDFAELDKEMLDYTKKSFLQLFNDKDFTYYSSSIWHEERKDFSPKQLNISRKKHIDVKNYELLKGEKYFSGQLFGGCAESMHELINPFLEKDAKKMNDEFHLFPAKEFFKNKVLFLETSELKWEPKLFKKMIQDFKDYGVFENLNGLLIGKPQDEVYYEEYKQIYLDLLKEYDFPIVYNLNVGHAYPKMLLQYDALVEVDMERKSITIKRK